MWRAGVLPGGTAVVRNCLRWSAWRRVGASLCLRSAIKELCGVKPHVLRYWEQEFSQLRPMKRTGNRRYYQHREVLMIRRIRELLYEQGFTISGARNQLQETAAALRGAAEQRHRPATSPPNYSDTDSTGSVARVDVTWEAVRCELQAIKNLLAVGE